MLRRHAGAREGKCCTLGRRRSLLYSTTPPAAHARRKALRLTVVPPPCAWGRNHKPPVTETDRLRSQNCSQCEAPGTPGPYQVLWPWAHSKGTYVQKGALHICPHLHLRYITLRCSRCTGLALVHPHCQPTGIAIGSLGAKQSAWVQSGLLNVASRACLPTPVPFSGKGALTTPARRAGSTPALRAGHCSVRDTQVTSTALPILMTF